MRSYGVLIGLALIFVSPVLIAKWYYDHQWFNHTAFTYHGHLVSEAAADLGGGAASKWRLIYIPRQGTPAMWLQAIDQLARVRLALGRYGYGLALEVWLPTTSPVLDAQAQHFLKEIAVSWRQRPEGPVLTDQVWLINEAGKSVLSYTAVADKQAIFADLNQLKHLWRI